MIVSQDYATAQMRKQLSKEEQTRLWLEDQKALKESEKRNQAEQEMGSYRQKGSKQNYQSDITKQMEEERMRRERDKKGMYKR